MQKKVKLAIVIGAIAMAVIAIILILVLVVFKHNHSFGEWEITDEATCTKSGMQIKKCSCGEIEESEISPEHKYLEGVCIYCAELNPSEGLIFTKNNDYLGGYSVSMNYTYDTTVVVPSYYEGLPITKISDNGFNVTAIECVILPDTLKVIGADAFRNCKNLKTINIPSSVTTIGECAFKDCQYLESITIPNNVTEIADSTFFNCKNLTSITLGSSLTSIGTNAFTASGIVTLTIPNNVQTIGISAFSQCIDLESVNIGNGVKYILNDAFFNCKNLKNLSLGTNVTSIYDSAFASCSSLPFVEIPDNVLSLGYKSFSNCTSLKVVRINASVIGEETFLNCKELREVILTDKVNKISAGAFENCVKLTMIYLGKGLSIIENGAFSYCNSLSYVYFSGSTQELNYIVNKGLNYTLNHCLQYATGEFIARQDGDDISLPYRLEKQIEFLANNPDFHIVSSSMIFFDENGDWGKSSVIEKPSNTDVITGSPICHAPVMMHKYCIDSVNGYTVDKKMLRVEDVNLWIKLYSKGYRCFNLSEPLYKMRNDENALNRRKYKYRINSTYTRILGCRQLNLGIKYYILSFKPMIIGLIPAKIRKFIKRKRSKI